MHETKTKKISFLENRFFFSGRKRFRYVNIDAQLITELARQNTMLDTSDNLVGDNINAGLLSDNDLSHGNINMDTKAKSNLDENITDKDNMNELCKDDLGITIENLF